MSFDTTTGESTQKFVRVGAHSTQGLRPTMEDRHLSFVWRDWTVAAILDGHGGAEAAIFVADHLHSVLCHWLTQTVAMEEALTRTVVQLHEAYREEESFTQASAGCTLVMLLLSPSLNQAWCVHCGDARAVQMQYQFGSFVWQWSSSDHSLDRPSQLTRIQSLPDFTIRRGYLLAVRDGKPHGNGLNLARSIGDFAHEPAISCLPEISQHEASPGSVWVLSCDGLVEPVQQANGSVAEAVSKKDMVRVMQQGGPPDDVCERLVNLALSRNSRDNITCMVCIIDTM